MCSIEHKKINTTLQKTFLSEILVVFFIGASRGEDQDFLRSVLLLSSSLADIIRVGLTRLHLKRFKANSKKSSGIFAAV